MAVDRSRLPSGTRLALVERETSELRDDVDDHELRIRPLEHLGAKVVGWAAAGGTIAGVVTAIAAALIARGGP